MKDDYYKTLVERYLNKEATKTELAVFFKLLSDGKLDSYLKYEMDKDLIEPKVVNQPFFKRYSFLIKLAAMLLIAISIGTFFIVSNDGTLPDEEELTVMPGSSKAVLVLSDGKEIVLNNQDKKFSEGNVGITANDKGVITYDLSKLAHASAESNLKSKYNTIRTPHGGTFKVLLPDGSTVWLNSLSSITFPLQFDSQQRMVTMEGEVYFDVLHADSIPFVVNGNGHEVHVLGTQFNINSYDDEHAVRTTLVEGSVLIKTTTETKKLEPGEQSVFVNKKNKIHTQKVDLAQVTAWKEGYFRFDKVDLPTLVRQISRWYNVDVVFKDTDKSDAFTGRIKRSEKIEEVIKVLKKAKVNIRLENQTLYVEN